MAILNTRDRGVPNGSQRRKMTRRQTQLLAPPTNQLTNTRHGVTINSNNTPRKALRRQLPDLAGAWATAGQTVLVSGEQESWKYDVEHGDFSEEELVARSQLRAEVREEIWRLDELWWNCHEDLQRCVENGTLERLFDGDLLDQATTWAPTALAEDWQTVYPDRGEVVRVPGLSPPP